MTWPNASPAILVSLVLFSCVPLTAASADRTDYLYGLLDPQGRVILPPKYEQIGRFRGPHGTRVKIQGKMVIKPKYEEIEGTGFSQEHTLAKVKLHGDWGLIDRQDRMVVAPKYDRINTLSSGYYLVRVDPYATKPVQPLQRIEKPKIARPTPMPKRSIPHQRPGQQNGSGYKNNRPSLGPERSAEIKTD